MDAASQGLVLDGLRKSFGATRAVDDVHLAVEPGERIALLGPSGSGKSTILRCIAGHIEPDGGAIRIGGAEMSGVPPEKRNVGMVFQNHALFPHLTVRRNVTFGPERRGTARGRANKIADQLLDRVGLGAQGDKYPRTLSGGEAQRVALARALAIRPSVLLLDEPFSSADATLRRDLRALVGGLQREYEATTVWVTHDQEEALAVADRVAVLHQGRIHQCATPRELYTRPTSEFVANFVGRMNILDAEPHPERPGALRLAGGTLFLAKDEEIPADEPRILVGVRPEAVEIGHPPPTPGYNSLGAVVKQVVYLGDRLDLTLEIAGGQRLLARGNSMAARLAREEDRIRIHWPVSETRRV